MQVRGTPVSGKTTLAVLLGHYILEQEPSVHVIFINKWPVENVKCPYGYNFELKSIGWSVDRDTVFIFDNAESTYVDSDLWTGFFKHIHDYPCRRAILFSSYGSPSRFITGRGSRFCVTYSQMVTLRAVQHQDDLPATGLLFSRVEFDDLISKDEYLFDLSFFDEVFNATGGHVGAVKVFLSVITAHEVGLCYLQNLLVILHYISVVSGSQAPLRVLPTIHLSIIHGKSRST